MVGLCLDRGPDLVTAILAAWLAGAAYLPLDPGYPADRLAFMLADSRAAVVAGTSAALEDVPARRVRMIETDDPRTAAAVAGSAPVAAGPCPARAAGVRDLHVGVDRDPEGGGGHARAGWRVSRRRGGPVRRVVPGCRVLQLASAGFDASVLEVCLAFAAGGTLVVPPPGGPVAGRGAGGGAAGAGDHVMR